MARYVCKKCGHVSDIPEDCPNCGGKLEPEEEVDAEEEAEHEPAPED